MIAAVGENVSHLKPGDRVMALTGWGSFAEQVAVPHYNVLPIPQGMDFTTAAAFSMTYGTSMHALTQRARLQPGETLLVLGASGGVGLAAVEIGKALGARVIAAASSAEKLEVARNAGADELINYSETSLKDEVKRLTQGNGADVIYDPVGGDLFDQAIRSIAWNGRLLVVGFASGRIPELPVNLTLLKGASVVGVFWGSFAQRQPQDNAANFKQLFAWFEEGKLKPLVSTVYPLERAGRQLICWGTEGCGEGGGVGWQDLKLTQKHTRFPDMWEMSRATLRLLAKAYSQGNKHFRCHARSCFSGDFTSNLECGSWSEW